MKLRKFLRCLYVMISLGMSRYGPMISRNNSLCARLNSHFQAKNNPIRSESSSTYSTSHFWTHLWGLHIAPKVNVLENVQQYPPYTKKSITEDHFNIAMLCHMLGSEEDILHTFLQCQIATEIWLNSNFLHLVNLFLSQVSHQAIIELIIGWPACDNAWFAYFLWYIWNSRNNILFQNTPPVSLTNYFTSYKFLERVLTGAPHNS